jgi:hypothetical protein
MPLPWEWLNEAEEPRPAEATRDAVSDSESGGPRAVRVRVPPPASIYL